jgi:N-acetylneuraminic acid mutarotase
MKKINLYFLVVLLALFAGCKKSDDDDDKTGDWTRKADFEGTPRNAAFSFTAGDYAYVGTGYDGTDRLTDMWRYDSSTTTWYKMADFPGKARSNAVAFTINGKGYAGSGYDGDVALSDFYEYDPTTNTWKQIADLPAAGRYNAVAFAIGNIGYVGTGRDSDEKDQADFYSYDPSLNSWTKISSLGVKRSGAFAFVIGSKAFVGGGINNGSYEVQFYEFEPARATWVEKRDLNRSDDDDNDDDNDDYNLTRAYAASFVIGNYAYITGGTNGGSLLDAWKYDLDNDNWIQVDDFEGSARQYAVGFTLGAKGYVATGGYGSTRYDDNWSFDPSVSDDED